MERSGFLAEPVEAEINQEETCIEITKMAGGEGGIRTLDTLPYTHFPGVLLQPLGHLTS